MFVGYFKRINKMKNKKIKNLGILFEKLANKNNNIFKI